MKKFFFLIACLTLLSQSANAQFLKTEMLKILKADAIKMDEENGDGVFNARNKKTKKWGMFQGGYENAMPVTLIPMIYDSINFIPFNGAFTAVYKSGKAGFYLSPWSYDDAKQTVQCLYDNYQRFTVNNRTYLAVVKNGKWGWVDWLTGEEKSNFDVLTKEELTSPDFIQEYR